MNCPLAALAVLIGVDGYLRPRELLSIRVGDLKRPTSAAVKHWVILLYPTGRGETSKVGEQDDTIILDSGRMEWLGAVLEAISTRDPAEPLFSMDEFTAGLLQLVKWATDIAGARRVLLALPIPYPFGSTAHTISKVVLPATQEAAKKMSLQTIDLHTAFAGRREAFSDADHLQDADIDLMARTVAAAISSEPKL